MVIANARVAESAQDSARRTIEIRGSRIYFGDGARSPHSIDLSGHLLMPGLINAHDHLEFNLFPRLGRRLYANATEWAMDIHRTAEPPLREQLRVPKSVRLFWGGMKNLLSGVTTVAHHNPYEPSVFDRCFPVRVVRRFGWAHSLAFSGDVARRFRRTPRQQPFIIHAGEGTDACARKEVLALDECGVLEARTIVVHGFGFDEAGFELIAKRRASLVWCPSSNLLTYGATLHPDRLNNAIPVALGTDSAISAAGDMIDELQVARNECRVDDESLYRMVTSIPARILRLGRTGALRDGARADIVAVEDRGQAPAEALNELRPEMVITGGRIHLISKRLLDRCDIALTAGFRSIRLEGRGEWLTPFDIPRLAQAAQSALEGEVRLAGRRMTQ